MASNVTSLTAAEAAKNLNTTMIQFNIEAKDSMQILDSWNEIQNNFRTSAEDLAASIGKVGAAAKLSGVSLQELEGYTTAIVSSTGISGSEAGTAIKGVLARTFRIGEEGEMDAGKTEQLLNSLGISVRKNATEFREFDAILNDIQKNWSSYSNVTKSNLAQTMAGVYHYSKFTALMENYNIAQEATTKALNSQNSAMDENQKHLDSISGRMGTLKSTIEEQYSKALSSDMFKDAISGMTLFVNALGVIIDKVGLLPVVIGAAVTALTLYKLATGAAVNTSITSILTSMAAGFSRLATAEFLATAGAVALQSALTLGLSVAITAIVTGLTYFITKLINAREEQNKLIDTLQKDREALEDQKKGLEELSKEYAELKAKQTTMTATTEEKKRLLEVQKELVKQYGVSITGVNGEGEAYADSVEMIRLRIKALEDEKKAIQEKLEVEVKKRDKDDISDLSDAIEKRKKALKEIKQLQDAQQEMEQNGKDFAVIGDNFINRRTIYKDSFKSQDVDDLLEKEQAALSKANENIKTLSAERKKVLDAYATDTIKDLQSSGAKISDEGKAFVMEFTKSLAVKPEDLDSLKIELEKFIKGVAGGSFQELVEKYNKFKADKNVDGINQTSDAIIKLVRGFADTNPELKNFSILMEEAFGDSSVALKNMPELNTNFINLKDEANSLINETSILAQAFDEMNNRGRLNVKTVAELIDKYPDLINKFSTEGKIVKVNNEIIQKKFEDEKKIYTDKYTLQINELENARNATLKKLQLDGLELSSKQTLLEMYEKLAQADRQKAESEAKNTRAIKLGGSIVSDEEYGAEYNKQMEVLTKAKYNSAQDFKKNVIDAQDLINKNQKAIELINTFNIDAANDTKIKNATSKATGSDFDQKYAKEYLAVVDELDARLSGLNAEYKGLESTTGNYATKQSKLNEILDIQAQKQKELHKAADDMRTKQKSIQDSMAISPLLSQDKIDAAYKKLSANGKKAFLEQYKDWQELDKAIAKAGLDWWSTREDIITKGNEKITLSFDEFSDTLEPIQNNLKQIQNSFEMIAESNFDKKFENIINQIVLQKDILGKTALQIADLESKILSATNDSAKELYSNEITKLKEQNGEISKNILSLGNTRAELLIAPYRKGLQDIDNEISKLGEIDNLEKRQAYLKLSIQKDKIQNDLKFAVEDTLDKINTKALTEKLSLAEEGTKAFLESEKPKIDIDVVLSNEKVVKDKIESLFYDSTQNTKEYESAIKDVDFALKLVGDNDLTQSQKLNADKIKLTTDEIDRQVEELKKLNAVTDENITHTDEFQKKKEDLKDTIQDLTLKLIENQKAQAENKLKIVTSVEQKIQDILKKSADKEKDILDEKLKKYEDYINEKIKLIDEEYNREQYEKGLKEERDKGLDIQKEMDKLSLDNSFEAQLKLKELKEEYAEQQNKISDMQQKHDVETRKNNLTKQLESEKKFVDNKKKVLDDEFSDEKLMLKAKEVLLQGSFESVKGYFQNVFSELNVSTYDLISVYTIFEDKFGSGMSILGEKIKNEFISQIKSAQIEVRNLQSLMNQVNSTSVDTSNNSVLQSVSSKLSSVGIPTPTSINTSSALSKPIVPQVDYNSLNGLSLRDVANKFGWSIDYNKDSNIVSVYNPKSGQTLKFNSGQGSTYGIGKFEGGTNYVTDAMKLKNYVGSFSNGGIITESGWGQLHGSKANPEFILNTNQMKNLVSNLAFNFMPKSMNNIPAAASAGDINLTINIDGKADGNTVKQVENAGNEILNNLKKFLNKNGTFRG